LILLYWDIGHAIVEKQQTARWGDSVVEQLAADLRAEFPHIRGFSANNLWLMRQLYSEYACQEFLEQLVQELAIMGALVFWNNLFQNWPIPEEPVFWHRLCLKSNFYASLSQAFPGATMSNC
jgi:hypothetical protein